MAEIDPAAGRGGRGRSRRCSHGRRFELVEPMAEPTYLHAVRGRYDPLRARLRAGPRFRKLVPKLRRLRQAGEARAGDVPGLRLQQSRKGDHGAAAGARRRRSAAAIRRPPPAPTARRPPSPPAVAGRRRSPSCRHRSANCGRSSRNCATTSPRTPTMSAQAFRKRRAKSTTARPSTARSTAKLLPDEAKALHEEGIEFHPLPILPDDQN